MYGLRSTIFDESPEKAEWLIDLLQKLGREDDAYHAVALLIIDYQTTAPGDPPDDDAGDGENALVDAGVEDDPDAEDDPIVEDGLGETLDSSDMEEALASLPQVFIRPAHVPADLQPGYFLTEMVSRVLDATPVNFHREARARRSHPRSA
ncbi:hypothetical protein BH23ACT6_BH23ACT6_24080 [soil metagenome]